MADTMTLPDADSYTEYLDSKMPIPWIVTHPNGEVEEVMAISGYDAKSAVILKDSRYDQYNMQSLAGRFRSHRKFPKKAGRPPND